MEAPDAVGWEGGGEGAVRDGEGGGAGRVQGRGGAAPGRDERPVVEPLASRGRQH